ncbi:MAG TPA: hypothetical protein VF820_03860 [Patescibacteria group bacterium]
MAENFLKGKGITVKVLEAEINNLFRLSPKNPIEGLDYIYLPSFLKHKKFAHILLKECFFILKPKGLLVIDYISSKEINFVSLEKLLWWLFKANYDILSHEKYEKGFRIVIKKRHNMFTKDDSIDKWTFGIITNGERDDYLEMIFKSIKDQKIPNYEIIVCGKYRNRPEKNFTYIPFNERADKGWISKKKNLIGEKAKYENLCIIHDRILLDKNWYAGMKKYGNAYELLGCVQIEKDSKQHAGDWLTLGGPVPTNYRVSSMHFTDWDWFTYLSGQLTILKKHIWKEVLWDETRFWNDAEDADISYRARDKGYIIRFNPFASCTAITWRHGRLPLKYDIREGLLPKDMLKRRLMRITARVIYAIPGLKQIMLGSYSLVSKTKFYKHFIYH